MTELTTPPVLVFPDWDAVADGSRPFHVYCDACVNGFGAALEQEQTDGSIKPIAYISRATLGSERHCTPLDLDAGSIVWDSQTPPRLPLGHQVPYILRPQGSEKHRQSGGLQRPSPEMARVPHRVRLHPRVPTRKREWQRRLLLSRLPEPATERDRNGSTSLTSVADGGIYLVKTCGLHTPTSFTPIPGVGLGGLMTRTENNALGCLSFTLADFCDFSHSRATYEA